MDDNNRKNTEDYSNILFAKFHINKEKCDNDPKHTDNTSKDSINLSQCPSQLSNLVCCGSHIDKNHKGRTQQSDQVTGSLS